MTVTRKAGFVTLAAILSFTGWEAGVEYSGHDSLSLIASADARVGRPLTPVSVAGVARRTTRRCAAGVYNC